MEWSTTSPVGRGRTASTTSRNPPAGPGPVDRGGQDGNVAQSSESHLGGALLRTAFNLEHVPVIDPNKRRSDAKELEPDRKQRFCGRTVVERTNSEIKDNYGGRHIRVKGPTKVFCHLMFGLLAITVKQLFNMLC